ncbi:hypothetical protein CERSUDRAFT_117677 [Gelatoporia subvermispora B]|uniref:Uncharacterized protein n=1 Tax=Ceriporiopsis subvermispora (strain B) TaxID=914234 RepID=M2Q9L8_CERS8|nr:hypothetical protein CERSUDRAFT_117677 [Gelatoporia subvermispora B]
MATPIGPGEPNHSSDGHSLPPSGACTHMPPQWNSLSALSRRNRPPKPCACTRTPEAAGLHQKSTTYTPYRRQKTRRRDDPSLTCVAVYHRCGPHPSAPGLRVPTRRRHLHIWLRSPSPICLN